MSTLHDETADAAPRKTSRRAKIWGWAGVGVLVFAWFLVAGYNRFAGG